MRYLWDFYQDYLEQAGALTRPLFRLCSHRLRLWDVLAAQRVDFFAANSRCVAARVAKHYRLEARVIHPPVDVDFFTPDDGRFPEPEDCYLYAGQITAYKRADQAVLACTRLGKRLIVAGAGEDEPRLRRLAGPTVSFAGRPDNAALRGIMRRCRALLFPGEEDFGIVPVEVLAAGRPVIAFGRGGATESVRHGETGILYPEQSVEALCAAIEEFESGRRDFDPAALAVAAGEFSRPRFLREFQAFLDDCLERYNRPD
jgi:glycosyltransferase involved in cell wall biosynthesis